MKKSKVYALCEGAIMVALATALSYVKLMELPQGGSVCIGMLPLFIYFYRWDWKHSFLAAFAYGLLQLIFDGAYAWGPTSMLLDYVLAFTLLGLACAIAKPFSNKLVGVGVGTAVVCFIRFMCSFLSGVLIWGNLSDGLPAWTYSLTYNGSYMLPETIMTTIAAVLIYKAAPQLFRAQND